MVLRLVLTLSLAVALGGCNSHRYYAEAIQYHTLATAVLISRGICNSPQDCQRRHLLFAEGGEFSLGLVAWGGAYITLFGTSDESLVQEITASFQTLHARLKHPKVVLTVYSSAHGETKVRFREVELS